MKTILFGDSSSTRTLVMHKFAMNLRAHSRPCQVDVYKTGEDIPTSLKTNEYKIDIEDHFGNIHMKYMLGVDYITENLGVAVNVQKSRRYFPICPRPHSSAPRDKWAS